MFQPKTEPPLTSTDTSIGKSDAVNASLSVCEHCVLEVFRGFRGCTHCAGDPTPISRKKSSEMTSDGNLPQPAGKAADEGKEHSPKAPPPAGYVTISFMVHPKVTDSLVTKKPCDQGQIKDHQPRSDRENYY